MWQLPTEHIERGRSPSGGCRKALATVLIGTGVPPGQVAQVPAPAVGPRRLRSESESATGFFRRPLNKPTRCVSIISRWPGTKTLAQSSAGRRPTRISSPSIATFEDLSRVKARRFAGREDRSVRVHKLCECDGSRSTGTTHLGILRSSASAWKTLLGGAASQFGESVNRGLQPGRASDRANEIRLGQGTDMHMAVVVARAAVPGP